MRYIDCEVNDEFVTGSGVVIGAEGSHNDVALKLTFGDMWIGLNIYATFTDAQGSGSAVVMLMPSMLEDGKAMTYIVPIPADAKRYAGKSMLTLSGYSIVNGTQVDKATNTVTAQFRVLKSDYRLLGDDSITPSLAQQLQNSLATHEREIVEQVGAISDAVDGAAETAGAAFDSAQAAVELVESVKDESTEAARIAEEAKSESEGAKNAAEEAKTDLNEHKVSELAHSDIRILISELSARLNAVANSSDTDLDQLSEIVAYIKANKELIESVTTSKVSVSAIVDNLTTNMGDKPLSARMGVELKRLIDNIQTPDSNVPEWALQPDPPTYTKEDVGLGNVANERQYSEENPPPYPVTSVNGQSGEVVLGADDVGALPADTKIPEKTSEITNDSGFIKASEAPVQSVNGKSGVVVLAAGDVGARPATWTPTYSDVGADKSGAASSAVSSHNTNTDAHNDIRLLIEGLSARLNALANSTDDDLDQMAEIVAYIKANKALIESITTSKVSVADIVNNLTTNVTNKPLSAAQGVALKALIDAITVPTKLSELSADASHRTVTDTEKATWNAKSNFSGAYADLSGKPAIPTVPIKVSAFENDKGYLTAVPSGYAKTADHYTKTEADGKYQPKGNYLTSIPSEYVTETELAAMLEGDTLPDYWESYLPNKIAAIKALQDEGGKDCFSYVVMTDLHYPSNLGKRSPSLAKHIIDKIGAKYALVLGDVRTRGVKGTKAECEAEWLDVFEMLSPIEGNMLLTQGNHDAGYGNGDYDGDGDSDTYAYEFTPAEMFERVYRKAQKVGDIHYDNSGTAYYIDDVSNKVRFIMLNTQLNFDGNVGYSSYETVNGMAKYPAMWKYRYTQCQYDFLTQNALANIPTNEWSVIIGSHIPINQTGEMPEFAVMAGVLDAYQKKTSYSGTYAGTASGGTVIAYKNLAEPLPNNTTDTSKWVNGYRFSSSGISAQSGKTVSNFIPCKNGDKVRIKGVTFADSVDRIWVGKSDKSQIELGYITSISSTYISKATLNGDTYEIDIKNNNVGYIRFAMTTPTDASTVIVTVNEEIVETQISGYDAVSVKCDFTSAKGNLICYHGGHNHKDTSSKTCYQGGALSFPIITTRCDAQVENDDLANERVEGTITEQSFDVFTVNKAKGKIYATKIGAGADREISY